MEIHWHTVAHAKHREPSKEKQVNIWLQWEHKPCMK